MQTSTLRHYQSRGGGGSVERIFGDGSIESGSPGRSDRSEKSSDQSMRIYTDRQDEFLQLSSSKDSSKRSSESFETERSLAELETGSVIYHPAPSHHGSHNFHFAPSQQTLHTAPSLHETHFGVGRAESPLTILHPPGKRGYISK